MNKKRANCRALNKEGEPCKAAPTETGYCFIHSKKGRAAQIGREGGRRNRHYVDCTVTPLPLDDLRKTVETMIQEVHTGKSDARKTASLVSMLSLLRQLQRDSVLEQQIKNLQERVNKLVAGKAESLEETANS